MVFLVNITSIWTAIIEEHNEYRNVIAIENFLKKKAHLLNMTSTKSDFPASY